MEPVEMKEIQFDETKHFVQKEAPRVAERFLDMLRAEAAALAQQLISEGIIKTVRLIPIGAAVTMDSVPGRLTLSLDSSGKVVSADQE